MSKKNLSFLIFGTLPPPNGGVSISILNLMNSLKSLNISVELISKSNIFKFNAFDIAHVHYSKRWKVLAAIIIGKFLAKKTIVTKHGAEFYPKKLIVDKLILRLSDGLIVLNDEVYQRCIDKKCLIKLPPIFKEGIALSTENKQTYIKKEIGMKYLLIYAGGKVFINKQEVYGVNFLLDALSKLEEDIKVVLVDPQAAYSQEITEVKNEKLIYINTYIDFNLLVADMDLYIRPTSSDGNSIATLEALSQGTKVLASDVVERDENIFTYKFFNQKDFISKINLLLDKTNNKDSKIMLKSIQSYLDFCQTILKGSN